MSDENKHEASSASSTIKPLQKRLDNLIKKSRSLQKEIKSHANKLIPLKENQTTLTKELTSQEGALKKCQSILKDKDFYKRAVCDGHLADLLGRYAKDEEAELKSKIHDITDELSIATKNVKKQDVLVGYLSDASQHLDILIDKFRGELNGFDPLVNGAKRLQNMKEHLEDHSLVLSFRRPRSTVMSFFDGFKSSTTPNNTLQLINEFIQEVEKTIKQPIKKPVDSDTRTEAAEELEDFHRNF